MKENGDDVLLGASALCLSELDSERFTRRSSPSAGRYIVLCVALGVMLGVLLPGVSILVVVAPVGLVCWLVAAGFGVWTHRPSLVRRYGRVDQATAEAALKLHGVDGRVLLARAPIP